MTPTNVPTTQPGVTATTTARRLDTASIEDLDPVTRTVKVRLSGAEGSVVLAGGLDEVYRLVIDADRLLGQLYR
ncbi:MAG: hypothetical protein AAGA93_20765 [Actinomycetota bacterium]